MPASPAGWQDRSLGAWLASWRSLGARDTGALAKAHRQLLAAYAEPQRHYHTLQHLRECFVQLEALAPRAERPAEVTIALWFHDAVYEPRRHDNEARSARWAVETAGAAGIAPAAAERIHDLVMATRHAVEPATVDARVLVDVDLSILGAAAPRYDEFEQQVRAEYAWVPAFLYRRRRRAILQGFLDRPRIYAFLADLEAPARSNLRRALARLGG